MALSKVTYVDGVTIIGAKNLNDIQDELIRQGEQQAADEEATAAALALKADKSTTYTKTEVDSALALKADKSDTYTKAQMDASLALKADKSDTYTKAEVDASLELKADKAETYTKAQVDSMIQEAVEEAVKESEYSNFEMKSVSGDFIHITDGAGLIPVKDLKIGIDAVQDLHGYDAPWVGGAGKNVLPPILFGEVSSIESNGVTLTIDNQKFKFVGTASNGGGRLTLRTINFDLPAGTYIISSDYSGSFLPAFIQDQSNNILARTGGGGSDTVTLTETTRVFVGFNLTEGQVYNTTTTVMIRKSTDTDEWQPYANICPISGWTGAKVSVNGVNQWDEEWEVGAINLSTGANQSSSTNIRSKNYIPIKPSTDYYFKKKGGSSGAPIYYVYYDKDKNRLASNSIATSSVGAVITTRSDAHYIRFYVGDAYGTTYGNNISINYPSTYTDYHAYDGKTYEVTWEDEAGTVYGGTLDVTTGELVVDKASKDMGDIVWNKLSNGKFYSNEIVGAKAGSSSGGYDTFICSAYKVENVAGVGSLPNGSASMDTGRHLQVHDDTYTDVSAFQTALAGQTVCYELATPVSYTIDPTEVLTLLGENNIFADTGAVEELIYRISRQ